MQPTKTLSMSFFHHTHLNEEQLAHPEQVIHQFCELLSLEDVRHGLWLWLTETIAAPDTHYEDRENRAELLFLYNQLLYVMDAVYLLDQQYSAIQQRKISAT
jgi:hypothetical protein